jgi:hypothetical protein
MASSGDTGANMQHIYNKTQSKAPFPKYRNPITSGQIQDIIRHGEEYSHDNPEPPALKL